jgi:squalene-hopene/tetraprenyl-beta-curcumene cyclase
LSSSVETSPRVETGHALDDAIDRAQRHLLAVQSPDGHWLGELEADASITSEYVLFGHLIDRRDTAREAKAVRYLRDCQRPNGGWNLYKGGPPNLSVTLKAYFALKVAGTAPDEPVMSNARQLILASGGPVEANVFTKILLALFGEYEWSGLPAMPPEMLLLPSWAYFNLSEVSYWSRTVIVPLLVLLEKKPVKRLPHARLDELWPVPRDQARLRFRRMPRPFSPTALLWKNVFIGVDDCLKAWKKLGPTPLRSRGIEAARCWLEERLAMPGGLGGIFPAMVNAVLALRALGYPDDHPLVQGQIREIDALTIEDEESLHCQACVSPVWDTALAVNALVESGVPPEHPALVRAEDWLLDRQILSPGDWRSKRPHLEPGGWPFQYDNAFYPDLDDTAMVMMGLHKIRGHDPGRKQEAMARGLRWFLGMQSSDGGWGAFDVDNSKLFLNHIPFADHGALLDPSTADLTARGLELMGTLGYGRDHEVVRRAISFLQDTQRPAGSWYGRWGVNYIYGTWSVLRGLAAVGEDSGHPMMRRAVQWLEDRQNPDGGWGETAASYEQRELAGRGESTPSHTAWALLGLLAAGRVESVAVERGIAFLLQVQAADGSWEDQLWNGTGFPRVFYLHYHLYAKYFPLWALGVYRAALRPEPAA